jgi:hypothetical protein
MTNNVFSLHAIQKQLRKIFSRKQLMMIENAFEQGKGGLTDELRRSDRNLYIKCASSYWGLDATERLEAIMNNIIQNNGEFVPIASLENIEAMTDYHDLEYDPNGFR